MTPSVGRVVHFCEDGQWPRAALITYVGKIRVAEQLTEVVGLAVFNPDGMAFVQDVRFSEAPKSGCWSWPPRVP